MSITSAALRRLNDIHTPFEHTLRLAEVFEANEGRALPVFKAAVELGYSPDRACDIAEIFESCGRPHAYRRLYERAPRTKAYGPFQDPDRYFSAEKLRAYNYAASTSPLPVPVGRLPEREWWPLVREVFRRDDHICTYCGADGETYILHCDHIIPVTRGGQNVIENLTTACEWCNCSKRDALPHEWRPIRAEAQ